MPARDRADRSGDRDEGINTKMSAGVPEGPEDKIVLMIWSPACGTTGK
jgi:hypothetical protein